MTPGMLFWSWVHIRYRADGLHSGFGAEGAVMGVNSGSSCGATRSAARQHGFFLIRPRLPVSWWILAYIVLPLAVGGVVYVFWRVNTLRWYQWASWIGFAAPLRRLRALAAPVRSAFPSWVIFSLPGGLWLFATTNAVRLIWGGDRGKWRTFWLTAAFALGVGSELGQAVGIVPGRFDPMDLTLYLGGFLLAFLCRVPVGKYAPT